MVIAKKKIDNIQTWGVGCRRCGYPSFKLWITKDGFFFVECVSCGHQKLVHSKHIVKQMDMPLLKSLLRHK